MATFRHVSSLPPRDAILEMAERNGIVLTRELVGQGSTGRPGLTFGIQTHRLEGQPVRARLLATATLRG